MTPTGSEDIQALNSRGRETTLMDGCRLAQTRE
jgi:hypothetical protein